MRSMSGLLFDLLCGGVPARRSPTPPKPKVVPIRGVGVLCGKVCGTQKFSNINGDASLLHIAHINVDFQKK